MAATVREQVLRFALGLPAAFEDHPWGDTVVKVGKAKKVFVFMGPAEGADQGMSVKLSDSHTQAMAAPGAAPTGYGLGKAGWVSVPFGADCPDVGVLCDWVEESYRAVAIKKLVAELDSRP